MADTYINSDTADIPSVNFAQQGSDITAPAASRWQLFFKSTGLWAITNAASAFRFAKHVMTAAGDLTIGGASGVETALAIGDPGDVLTVNGGGTAPEWAAPAAGAYTEGVRVRRSTDQTISNNAVTAVSFDTEVYDTDTMHEGVTHPTRITINTPGKYLIGFAVSWAATGSNTRRYHQLILNNSVELLVIDHNHPQVVGEYLQLASCTLYDCAQNDYVELRVGQWTGGDLALKATGTASPVLWAERVG